LARCESDLSTCQSNGSGNLSTCLSTLQACNSEEESCETSLGAAQAHTCGNGKAEPSEPCDGANLQGETCVTQGFTYGKLACSDCMFDTSGCTNSRFVDNGLTVVDNQTGLEWEKKDEAGGLHDKDNFYTWNQAMGDWISDVNGRSADGQTHIDPFAGHTDWRLPQIDELRTILDCNFGPPCIDPIFGPTVASLYWSATTDSNDPTFAWVALFFSGNARFGGKASDSYVRAVRAGSN